MSPDPLSGSLGLVLSAGQPLSGLGMSRTAIFPVRPDPDPNRTLEVPTGPDPELRPDPDRIRTKNTLEGPKSHSQPYAIHFIDVIPYPMF